MVRSLQDDAPDTFPAEIRMTEPMGSEIHVHAECADGMCPILRIQTSEMSEKEQFELIGKKKLSLKVRESTVNIFDTVDGRNLAVVNAVPVPEKQEADIGTGGSDKKKKKDKKNRK